MGPAFAVLGQRDDGRATQAERELTRELDPGHAADSVRAKQTAHVGYLTDTMSGENRDDLGRAALSGRLVRVLATPSVPEGLLARGILESEGIPVLTKGEGEGPYRMGPVQLWVPEELEFQARLLLEGPPGGETAVEDSEDTTEDRDRP